MLSAKLTLWSLQECRRSLESHFKATTGPLVSVCTSYECAQACVCVSLLFALHTLAHMTVSAWTCVHARECETCVCRPAGSCFSVRVENTRPSRLTSKMLARSAVWGCTLTGRLWWTTIYNNVKLTSSSWCAAGRRFNMTHPDCLLCSTLICVTRSCLWINNNATFYLRPVGRSFSAAYSPPTGCVFLESRSRCVHMFGLVVEGHLCTRLLQVEAE